ncbi:MAG: 4Fe-4S dicluster domain-containing protein [Promethearchaeota archaeon]
MTLKINFDFRKSMLKYNFSLNYCYQCGTCSGGCPIARITNGAYNPRKIIEAAILGFEKKLTEDLEPNVWLCTFCQLCVEQCPQNVDLTEVFLQIKNVAVRKGHAPKGFQVQAETILETGVAIPIGTAIENRRKRLGLPKVKESPVEEIQKLLKEIGFDKQIGYDWNKNKKE